MLVINGVRWTERYVSGGGLCLTLLHTSTVDYVLPLLKFIHQLIRLGKYSDYDLDIKFLLDF